VEKAPIPVEPLLLTEAAKSWITRQAEDIYQILADSEGMVRREGVKKKLSVYVLMLAVLCFFASAPPCAQSTEIPVSFVWKDLGGGTYEYTWTVVYDGRGNGFGELEVYLPTWMNSATNNVTTLNGSENNWLKSFNAAGPTVSYPWNAMHFNAALTKWPQAGIHLESPPKDGFDPQDKSEIEFGTSNNVDVAGTYQFSYRLKYGNNQYLTSFYYELHDAREADSDALQKATAYGTAAVPLPPSVFLLGTGLLGLAGMGLRRKRS
jgi:hypothetical protein